MASEDRSGPRACDVTVPRVTVVDADERRDPAAAPGGGFVLIAHGGRPIGLATAARARDAELPDGATWRELGTSDTELVSVAADQTVESVLALMDEQGVDAVPVLADDGGWGVTTRGAALEASLHRMTADQRQRVDRVVLELALLTGERFLQRAASLLAEQTGARSAFVGELLPDGRVVTRSGWAAGSALPALEYKLAGTPCELVVDLGLTAFQDGVAGCFPSDGMLVDEQIRSYVGAPVRIDGRTVGILSLLHDGPFPEPLLAAALLPVLAPRVAAELERLQAIHEVEKAGHRYRMLLNEASDGIFISDSDGRYIDVNPRGCEIAGYEREELLEMTIGDLIAPEDLKRRPLMYERLKAGQRVSTERWLRAKDDARVPVDISARVLSDGTVMAIMRDITERKEAEEKLNDYHQMLHTIRMLQSRYIADTEPEKLFELMLRGMLRRTRSEYGFIGEVREGRDGTPFLQTFAMHSVSWNEETRRRIEERVAEGLELRDMNTLFGSVILLGAPVIANNPSRDPRHTFLPEGHPELRSFLGLPLYAGGRLVGCAGLANRPGGYEDGMPDFLEPLTTTCANIIAGYRQTQQRQTAEALAARLGRILDQTSGEILVFSASDRRFIEANRGARMELGYDLDELRELTLLDLLPHISREHLEDILAQLEDGQKEEVTFETLQRRKHGTVHPVEVRLQFSHAETPGLFVAIVRDITARKQAEGQISYLVHYDSLTGLPNRLLLVDRLKQAVVEAAWDHTSVAVMFLDLDRFKTINDTLGHDAGDQVLAELSERLKEVLPRGDTLARLGGDEFAVVLSNVKHVEEVARVAQRVLGCCERPFAVNGQELFSGVSIGITLYPDDATDVGGLLRNADTALHHAKSSGRATYQFFTAEMNERVVKQLSLETSLRRALERSELAVYYQPKMELQTGRIIGAEALLRWKHPTLGWVSPDQFIALAEETGLIVPIGQWVLERACEDCAKWHAAGHEGLHVSVNVSLRQLQAGMVDVARRALARSSLPPQNLELELTESILMHDVDAMRELWELRALEVCFAIDDFGTGYSSLSYLKRFPFDSLKIDRSFVRDVAEGGEDAAIAGAIVAMAHRLGLTVCAEGVETRVQLEFLRAQGCDAFQGFLISEATPAEDFLAMVESGLKAELPT